MDKSDSKINIPYDTFDFIRRGAPVSRFANAISQELLWGDILACISLIWSSIPVDNYSFWSLVKDSYVNVPRSSSVVFYLHSCAYAVHTLVLPLICGNRMMLFKLKALLASSIFLFDWMALLLSDTDNTELFIWFNVAISIFLISCKQLCIWIADSDEDELYYNDEETVREMICRIIYDQLVMLAGFAVYTLLNGYRSPLVASTCVWYMAIVGGVSSLTLLAASVSKDWVADNDPMALQV